ncbi:tRNA-uridine aminocarboxypropyltransferase [Bermanella sp. WJH001]|uniref:tRNA-uridine aminocarboxypropyltransferase n=1 Tax=Bermanella sp. WJH001 TaxID=3048005 RepID=UPI0024BD8D19|nr:tRNA-uridine aminocarboxypropyltransferase [Bermanella sp. WJH001]MDJ1537643.1 tRNA-uridine aminocarboxypropyltransferase [Bermanella sp. WJH001]
MPRKLCEHCQRPLAVCICPYLVNLQAPCRLLILQHPSEQKQALATVPLLQLCIKPLDVLVGEEFEHLDVVQGLLRNPKSCRVLFPAANSEEWNLTEQANSVEGIETLIIIDGTWRKAKRIWHMNPWLAKLPCVHLSNIPSSQYQIRSSSIEGGVSTLEAVMHGCHYLSSNKGGFDELLKPFNAMVDMQIKKMGQEVFLAHYAKQLQD